MSKKRKDEVHAAWVAKGAQDAANAASEAALGPAGSGSSLPAAAATQQDKRTPVANEKRPNPNMMLMSMCGMMGMLPGLDPSLEQVSALSWEFERMFKNAPCASTAACATTRNGEPAGQDDVKGNVGEYNPAIRAYSHDRGLSRMEAYATTGSTQGKERRHEVDLGDIPRFSRARLRAPRTGSSNRLTARTSKRASPAQ